MGFLNRFFVTAERLEDMEVQKLRYYAAAAIVFLVGGGGTTTAMEFGSPDIASVFATLRLIGFVGLVVVFFWPSKES